MLEESYMTTKGSPSSKMRLNMEARSSSSLKISFQAKNCRMKSAFSPKKQCNKMQLALCRQRGNASSTHGVSFLIQKDLAPKFERIADRVGLNARNLSLIAGYAQTLPVCKFNPIIRDDFYQSLDPVICKTPD